MFGEIYFTNRHVILTRGSSNELFLLYGMKLKVVNSEGRGVLHVLIDESADWRADMRPELTGVQWKGAGETELVVENLRCVLLNDKKLLACTESGGEGFRMLYGTFVKRAGIR